MDVSIVVAMSTNGVIGKDGSLPWYLPADLQHFKSITMGRPIIMGRLTHESIGRPLPGRENIVLSRDVTYLAEGCRVIHDLDEISGISLNSDEVMVIGGARVYADTLPLANRLFITEVHTEVQGDVYFPKFDRGQWQETGRQFFEADTNNEFDYSFVVLARISHRGTG